jgi:hypothetical protein
MPAQQGNDCPGNERPAASPPPVLPKTFWKSFVGKMAITARVLGKELYRFRLRRLDLPRADLRLGQKAHALGVSGEQTELFRASTD